MRVLHIVSAVAPRYGGTTTTIFPLVEAINRSGDVRAEIATTDADGPNRRLSASELPAGIPVHLFPRTWSEQWKYSRGLQQWLSAHARDYDFVHIHGVWSFSTIAAGRAARRADVQTIVCPQGMLLKYSWEQKGLKKQIYWTLVEKKTIWNAAGFHVTSEEEAGEIQALRPDARLFVIPHGVEPTAFTAPTDATSLRKRCGNIDAGVPILLYLSRLHPKKGIVDRLLPAMAKLKSRFFLAIAGSEDSRAPGYEHEMQRTIERLGLQKHVALLGEVSGDDRWPMYDGAAAFVLPSHSENFGIVVAEAMARGCPSIVNREVQSSALLERAGAGLVVDGEAAAFASAIDSLLTDGNFRNDASARGRAFAAEHLDWLSIAEQVKSMYFTLAQEN